MVWILLGTSLRGFRKKRIFSAFSGLKNKYFCEKWKITFFWFSQKFGVEKYLFFKWKFAFFLNFWKFWKISDPSFLKKKGGLFSKKKWMIIFGKKRTMNFVRKKWGVILTKKMREKIFNKRKDFFFVKKLRYFDRKKMLDFFY